MKNRRQNRRGFTLVELSIVLVIIGLIIGGILTGQQVIQNARVTRALNDVQAYEGQFQTYVQNFGALPGDDITASTRFPNAVSTNGNGDGTLGVQGAPCSFDSTTGGDECHLVWADLRAAGLVKNQTPITNQPANPFNGVYGFQTGAFSGSTAPFTTMVLCLNNVPSAAAQALDTQLDDGVPNTGSFMAVASGTAPANATPVASYTDGQSYTMCIRM